MSTLQISDAQLPLQKALHWAKTRPNDTFLTQPLGGGRVEDYSWERTLSEARRMAAHLKSLNFPPKSQIAILSKNCAHFFFADLAIWMAGHCSVAIYPTLSGESVRYILEHSEAKLLFVGKLDTWAEQKSSIPGSTPCIAFPLAPPTDFPKWDDVVAKHPPLEGTLTRPADDLAVIMYTSGSTGRPKGVMHSFRTMASAAQGFISQYNIGEQDRMLSYLPLAHVFERACVEAVGLMAGTRVFFAESLETFVEDVKRARPTLFISVPRLWTKFQQGVLKKMPPEKLNRLLKIPILSGIVKKKILTGLGLDQTRIAGSGSAPLPDEVMQWYRRLGLELCEGYGMSENFAHSHTVRPKEGRPGYVGKPSLGVECKLSPEGEVLVKSPATMLGYFKDPAQTKEVLGPDGFLRTGDRGEIASDGSLKLTGRVKELFKTAKGKYVAPAPIENLLNSNIQVELSCVAGNGEAAAYGVVLVAEDLAKKLADAEARQSLEKTLKNVLDDVNAKVEEYEKLAFLVVAKDRWTIENGMLTPTMKIRRSAIEAAYAPYLKTWYAQNKPVIWQ